MRAGSLRYSPCSSWRCRGEEPPTFRASIENRSQSTVLKLEGKLAGPYVDECRKAWLEMALDGRRLSLDLRGLTFADSSGIELLRSIYHQTRAEILAGSPLTSFFAECVMRAKP